MYAPNVMRQQPKNMVKITQFIEKEKKLIIIPNSLKTQTKTNILFVHTRKHTEN